MQNDSEVTAKVLEIMQTYCEHVETGSGLAFIRLGIHYSAPLPSQLKKQEQMEAFLLWFLHEWSLNLTNKSTNKSIRQLDLSVIHTTLITDNLVIKWMGHLKNLKLRNRFIFGDKIIVFMTFTELQFKETPT